MKAVTIVEAGRVEVIEADQPLPGPDEVLVRSRFVGISERDVELYRGKRPEQYYRYPIVPGHEWTGETVDVGAQVHGIVPGDRVVVESLVFCGVCRNCRQGDTNLCEAGYDELGFTRPGGLAEYAVVPSRLVHVLPENVALDEAILVAPMAVVTQAFARKEPRPGDVVCIVGDGTVSLLATQLARMYSPRALIVVGLHSQNLELARRSGATHVVHIGREDPQELVLQLSNARGADLVFEGVGNADATVEAMLLARRGGTVILGESVSNSEMLHVESGIFTFKQLAVYGVFGASSAAWSYAVDLIARGQLELASLISHRFALEEYEDALEILRLGSARKILLEHTA
jgi:threonine dehydrogenase-like Zn-dependent dehydrogenase